jgi:P pilus assembly chaperone PapD
MKPFAILAAVLMLATLSATAVPAQTAAPAAAPAGGANLNISPKRITFDRNHRSGTIYLFNQGSGPGTFDISLVDRVMLPDGQIIPMTDAVTKPETKVFADKVQSAETILQVAPRRVTLAPGQGQTIRLRVTGAQPDPSIPELRTHLTISTLPPREAGVTAEGAAANAPPNQLRFQINALLAVSIPAIVRLNDLDLRAGLDNASITFEQINGPKAPAAPVLNIDIVRKGANSLFGILEVRTAGQPRSAAIGVARGLGVYPEVDHRTVRIPLTRAPAPGEHLDVTFTDDDTSPGKLLAKLVL